MSINYVKSDFTQNMKAKSSRKKATARRRFVTLVTTSVLVITGCLYACSARDKVMEPKFMSIVQMERERAADAAEVNGYDVYLVPSGK